MKTPAFFRYPKVAGVTLACLSLLVGAVTLEAADFGAPGWVFVPLVIWLTTVGLPTTVVVLLLAAVWGTAAPLYGFWSFCLVAAVLAATAQVLALKLVARYVGGFHAN